MRVCARTLLAAAVAVFAMSQAVAQQAGTAPSASTADVSPVHGAPEKNPSSAWTLAAGGRIYDNWWLALGRKKPEGSHPAYPKTGQATGENTFRCKECHGWDYRGRDGEYAEGKHATGIKGIRGAEGRSPAAILAMLRAAPHSYSEAMLTNAELMRVAQFVSRGQHNVTRYIEAKSGTIRGDALRGRGIFETTCAVCHGYDGRLLNWGTKAEPEFIGTAVEISAPEVLHKIRNAHPGAAMISLRSFPIKDAVDVLAYATTLPTK